MLNLHHYKIVIRVRLYNRRRLENKNREYKRGLRTKTFRAWHVLKTRVIPISWQSRLIYDAFQSDSFSYGYLVPNLSPQLLQTENWFCIFDIFEFVHSVSLLTLHTQLFHSALKLPLLPYPCHFKYLFHNNLDYFISNAGLKVRLFVLNVFRSKILCYKSNR